MRAVNVKVEVDACAVHAKTRLYFNDEGFYTNQVQEECQVLHSLQG